MITAYVAALPPSALPSLGSVVAVIGPPSLVGALFAVLGVLGGALAQRTLRASARRAPRLRLLELSRGRTAPRRAA